MWWDSEPLGSIGWLQKPRQSRGRSARLSAQAYCSCVCVRWWSEAEIERGRGREGERSWRSSKPQHTVLLWNVWHFLYSKKHTLFLWPVFYPNLTSWSSRKRIQYPLMTPLIIVYFLMLHHVINIIQKHSVTSCNKNHSVVSIVARPAAPCRIYRRRNQITANGSSRFFGYNIGLFPCNHHN